jgi:CHAT domain-containing protein
VGELVLGDLSAETEGARRFLVVADDVLAQAPFEALLVTSGTEAGTQYLTELAPVVYLPSCSVMPHLGFRDGNPVAAPPSLLLAFSLAEGGEGFDPSPRIEPRTRGPIPEKLSSSNDEAFPPLRYVQEEVDRIVELFGDESVQQLRNERATESRFKMENLEDYSVIHLATHAFADGERPERSFIYLGSGEEETEDGFLWVDEIRNLKVAASLVVLSACQGARGEFVRGEGVIGISRALLGAGSGSVLASLWSVNDQSTALWMQGFYERLTAGARFSEAARGARVAMIRGNRAALRHPYYWAPFILIGKDGGGRAE